MLRPSGADAVRDVSRQLIRNREAFGATDEDIPVFDTSAAPFNVTAMYQQLTGLLAVWGLRRCESALPPGPWARIHGHRLGRAARSGDLGEIAAAVRGCHEWTEKRP